MTPSLTRYLKSSNDAIRNEYEIIAQDILQALRIAHQVNLESDNTLKLEHIAKLERMIEEGDITKNTQYSKLVAEKRINQTMATALLNDSHLKKLILQSIFELIRYHSLRELQKQVRSEDMVEAVRNKWIDKFRKKDPDKTEKIIEKLKRKQQKISKKLD